MKAAAVKKVNAIRRFAVSDVTSILEREKAQQEAARQVKELRASLGIFSTLKEANDYKNKMQPQSAIPLVIEPCEDGFQVSECMIPDLDGVPIYSGDILFEADDSFFEICWTPVFRPLENTLAFIAKPVKGRGDFIPYWLQKDKPEAYRASSKQKNEPPQFRHRQWTDEEKADWLEQKMKSVKKETAKPTYKCIGVILLFIMLLLAAGVLSMLVIQQIRTAENPDMNEMLDQSVVFASEFAFAITFTLAAAGVVYMNYDFVKENFLRRRNIRKTVRSVREKKIAGEDFDRKYMREMKETYKEMCKNALRYR